MVRVLIADDHRLFAEALRAILGAEPSVDVVGLAASGADAVRQTAELEPDVVLMDISMPDLDGFEVCRRLREVGVRTPALAHDGRDLAAALMTIQTLKSIGMNVEAASSDFAGERIGKVYRLYERKLAAAGSLNHPL